MNNTNFCPPPFGGKSDVDNIGVCGGGGRIRGNNPLNIRRGNTRWRGEIISPSLGGRGGSFVQFESVEWGLRAAFVILRTYAKKYHLYSPADIISRWAPQSENDTQRYIRNVCLWTGFGGQQRLTEAEWPALVKAMARQECGVILDDEVIRRAFDMASPPLTPPKGGEIRDPNHK